MGIKEMKQEKSNMMTSMQGMIHEGGEEREQDQGDDHQGQDETPIWIKGSKEDDNKRYRDLLKYMEEKRKEDRERLSLEEGKKKEAKKKADSWALLRLSMKYLKEKDVAWRQRRIEECDKIREEDKRDRLAVAREKKKRYGINKISKDENTKIKKRTEERLDIAKAKENLWKRLGTGRMIRRWRTRNLRLGKLSRRVWWSWKREEENGRLPEET